MLKRAIKLLSRTVEYKRKFREPLPEVPDISSKRFIFIGGLHRSGTSIIHRMLRDHPSVSGFHDIGVPEDEGQHRQSVIPSEYYTGPPGQFAFHPHAHLTEASDILTDENRGILLRQWGAYYDLDKSILLEKSPANLIRSRLLQAMFPGSMFVFIVRHPIPVSLATEKWSKRTHTERLLHWHAAHAMMLNDIQFIEHYRIIRYEDMIENSQRAVDDIFDMAGLPSFSPGESFENHNERYFNQWIQSNELDNVILDALMCGDKGPIGQFGYALEKPFVDYRSST